MLFLIEILAQELYNGYGACSEGTGNTVTYTYVDRYGNTATKDWTISDDEFLDSNSLTQEQITAICNKNNPGLVERGFDKAIYEFAQNKGINPKVLLATLAQEQGWCRSGNYKSAFGVGPGGNPLDFADGDKGGMATSVNTFLKLYNTGLELEKNGKLGAMFVNQDVSPYPETKAVFGSKTKEWQNNHPTDVRFMENGQYVIPVNAAMYAKLKYTPWVDFPAQGSHPLEDWQNIFRSFK